MRRSRTCTMILSTEAPRRRPEYDQDRRAILAMRASVTPARDSKRACACRHGANKKQCRIGEAKKPGPPCEQIVKIRGDGHCAYRAIGWHLGLTHQEVRSNIISQSPRIWQCIREDDQDGSELEAFLHETEHETWGGYAQIHVAAHIWKVCFEVRFGHIVHCFGRGRHCGLLYRAKGAKDPGAHYDVIILKGDQVGRRRLDAAGSGKEPSMNKEEAENNAIQEHREYEVCGEPHINHVTHRKAQNPHNDMGTLDNSHEDRDKKKPQYYRHTTWNTISTQQKMITPKR